MDLSVNPDEQLRAAQALDELHRRLHAGLPSTWAQPAGHDVNSHAVTTGINAGIQDSRNQAIAHFNELARHPHLMGAAMADLTQTDGDGAWSIGGSGGEGRPNPIEPPTTYAPHSAPVPTPPTATAVDPLIFAQQLHAGPGTGPTRDLANSLRQYRSGPYSSGLDELQGLLPVIADWTPVGTAIAAHLGTVQQQLSDLGDALDGHASALDNYADAFDTAKNRHPTPQEIQSTRKKLLAAMKTRPQDPVAVAQALAEFNEHNARSVQTFTEYTAKAGTSANPGDTGGDPSKPTTSGGQPVPSGTGTSNGNNGNQNSMMAEVLPALLSSAMSGANSQLSQNNLSNQPSLDPSPYLDTPLPSVPTLSDFGGGGGPGFPVGDPGGPSVPTVSTDPGPLPVVGAPALASTVSSPSTTPTAVIEPLPTAANARSAAAGVGTSPMGPYMPVTPGMGGGAGGSERSRVVAWHPDQKMFVDHTPHVEAVIGEKPTIAPTPTPATPAPANQAATKNGGSV
ncbi:hypothetical protein ACIRRA_37490 [Nocardia sp. NPDC101769]|uniref:hypothetical protein n=1 Tax=Nocardia sp. NPDC101769 TaxID=3364333 RepID=UPI003810B6CE